jgi:hypothetical protein
LFLIVEVPHEPGLSLRLETPPAERFGKKAGEAGEKTGITKI